MAIEIPEPGVLATKPLFKEDVGVDVGGAILVKLPTDHSPSDWLGSQLKLEEPKCLLLGQVQLWISQEPRPGVYPEL